MDMHPVCCRMLPSSTMHLLYLGEIMKHVVILLLYLYSLQKSTKTESVCDCRIMVWLCSHFCSSWRPRFRSSFISGTIVGEGKYSTMLGLQIVVLRFLIFTH